jgi:phosphopantothenate synthetase
MRWRKFWTHGKPTISALKLEGQASVSGASKKDEYKSPKLASARKISSSRGSYLAALFIVDLGELDKLELLRHY